jgi:protein phosphatase
MSFVRAFFGKPGLLPSGQSSSLNEQALAPIIMSETNQIFSSSPATGGSSNLRFHSPVKVEVAGLSHPGKVRSKNEDHFHIVRFGRFLETLQTNLPSEKSLDRSEDSSYGILVADGIGGGAAGEIASQDAISVLLRLVLEAPDWILHPADERTAQQVLERAAGRVAQVNEALENEARSDSGLQGFGTTFTAAMNLGRLLFVANVGDSRAYLFRARVLEQLTRDHTFTQDMIQRGIIAPEEASTHRLRHVLTRALGDMDVEGAPGLRQLQLQDGDSLLLCTDGLTDMVSDQQIASTLEDAQTCEVACRLLLDQALDAGGKDNITIAIARYSVRT